MTAEIRDARAADLDDIVEFASETWDGWDYVADIWDDWLEANDGETVVADLDGDAVGVLHATVRGDEAWLEGMRVHPDARREGVATALTDEVLGRLDVSVARCMAFDDNDAALALLDSLGFERAATVRHARGFGFPYGSLLEEANYDESLETLRATEVFEAFGGLYATTEWRMWDAPETVEAYDGDVLGFVEDDDVRGIALCDGVRVNTTGEEKRTELVLGMVWCEAAYASQFALDVRGEVRDRNLNDALVFLPDDDEYVASFERSGYDVSGRDHVYEKVIE